MKKETDLDLPVSLGEISSSRSNVLLASREACESCTRSRLTSERFALGPSASSPVSALREEKVVSLSDSRKGETRETGRFETRDASDSSKLTVVMLMIVLRFLKNLESVQYVPGYRATGCPHFPVSGSGEPEAMSAGMAFRGKK